MNTFVTLIQQVDLPTLIVMGLMLWFFKSRIDVKLDKLDSKIDKVEGSLKEDIKSLRNDVQDIDRRLCRLEGAFSNKDCCMIKDHRI